VYLPLAQHPVPRMLLLTRSTGDPLQLVQPVKEIVRKLDPNLPLLQTRSYDDLYRYNAVDGPGAATKMIGAIGVVGLLMALAGLYGLVAYNVSRRTREIGLRMALGAGPSDVLRLVMGKGLKLVGIGIALGVAMGFGIERLLKAALFNTGGVDMLVYMVVVPSMVVVTMLAAWLPARRAARIAPTQALRYE
jgi:ABC-type antimicrobial peptide transport system permease subunit